MKIQLLSDLHNEFYRPKAPPEIESTDADVVVLAGDIGVGLDGLKWAASEAERLAKPILYVAGNHEYYHHDISLIDEMREFSVKHDGIELLENKCVIRGGVRFIGCTLWTDYQAVGDREASMLEVRQRLSDHHVIHNGEWRFQPEDALSIHQQSKAWLQEQLVEPFNGKSVVVTHHGPHLLCKHPVFPMSGFGTAFLSDLSELVEQADIWCYGHTHANLDTQVGKCRLVSNQRGYPDEGVDGFDPAFTIDV